MLSYRHLVIISIARPADILDSQSKNAPIPANGVVKPTQVVFIRKRFICRDPSGLNSNNVSARIDSSSHTLTVHFRLSSTTSFYRPG